MVNRILVQTKTQRMIDAEFEGLKPRPVIWLPTGSSRAYKVNETSNAKITGLNSQAVVTSNPVISRNTAQA